MLLGGFLGSLLGSCGEVSGSLWGRCGDLVGPFVGSSKKVWWWLSGVNGIQCCRVVWGGCGGVCGEVVAMFYECRRNCATWEGHPEVACVVAKFWRISRKSVRKLRKIGGAVEILRNLLGLLKRSKYR